MKNKLLTILLFVISISFSQTKIGLRTGINLSDYTNIDTEKRTNFYAGIIVPIKLSNLYTLQPEVNYTKQGAIYNLNTTEKYDLFSDYISLAVANKFNIYKKVNLIIEPYLAIRLNSNYSSTYSDSGWIISSNYTRKLYSGGDIGIGFGLEYNLTNNLSLETRYKNGFTDIIDLEYFDRDINDQQNSTQVFQLGITYKFNLKKTK